MLSGGKLPWPRGTPRDYIHDLLVRAEDEIGAATARDLPPQWRRAIERGLARRRDDRTPTVTALKEGFTDAARRGDGPKPDDAAHERRTMPREPARARAAIAAGALAVGAAILLLTRLRTAEPEAPASAPLPPAAAPTTAPASPAPADERAPRAVTASLAPTRIASATIAPTANPAVLAPSSGEPATTVRSPASLSITADAWMLVSVDGGPAEQTPFRFERLSPGPHVVVARREGYKDIRLDVDIQAGETRLTLTPERAAP
jgi:hypothetical protein